MMTERKQPTFCIKQCHLGVHIMICFISQPHLGATCRMPIFTLIVKTLDDEKERYKRDYYLLR